MDTRWRATRRCLVLAASLPLFAPGRNFAPAQRAQPGEQRGFASIRPQPRERADHHTLDDFLGGVFIASQRGSAKRKRRGKYRSKNSSNAASSRARTHRASSTSLMEMSHPIQAERPMRVDSEPYGVAHGDGWTGVPAGDRQQPSDSRSRDPAAEERLVPPAVGILTVVRIVEVLAVIGPCFIVAQIGAAEGGQYTTQLEAAPEAGVGAAAWLTGGVLHLEHGRLGARRGPRHEPASNPALAGRRIDNESVPITALTGETAFLLPANAYFRYPRCTLTEERLLVACASNATGRSSQEHPLKGEASMRRHVFRLSTILVAATVAAAVAAQEQPNKRQQTDKQATTVDLDELEDHPEKYLGKTVTVEGEVDRVLGPHLFTIDERNWADLERELPVVVPDPFAAIVRSDARVRVTGTIEKVPIARVQAEAGFRDDPKIRAEIEAEPVLVATDLTAVQSGVALRIRAEQPVGTSGAGGSPPVTDAKQLAQGQPKDLVGKRVDLNNVTVAGTSDQGFWISTPSGTRVFVMPSGKAKATVKEGQKVAVHGTVMEMPESLKNQVKAETPIYVYADRVEPK
jgi:hypothetical protein